MSYSFSARAATKEKVLNQAAAKMDDVVTAQPIHKKDRDQALAAAEAFLELLPEAPVGKEYNLAVGGSLSWTEGEVITGSHVNVQASLVAKE